MFKRIVSWLSVVALIISIGSLIYSIYVNVEAYKILDKSRYKLSDHVIVNDVEICMDSCKKCTKLSETDIFMDSDTPIDSLRFRGPWPAKLVSSDPLLVSVDEDGNLVKAQSEGFYKRRVQIDVYSRNRKGELIISDTACVYITNK